MNLTDRVIVVLSGGQDSTTCLFWAKKRYHQVYAITFDYGQKHRLEIECATKIAKDADIPHEIIDVRGTLISMSPLTNDGVLLEKYESAEQMEEMIRNRRELTFVPMRNALFLTIAANRAEAIGAKFIVTGVCQMDNANYDDCRLNFIHATEDYINYALGHDHREELGGPIRILTPLMFLSKAQTVMLARELPGCWDALAYSHTSYDGMYPPTDMNHANVLRAKGFEDAGFPDPLVLRAYLEGLMGLPTTANYDACRQVVDDTVKYDR